IFGYATPGQLIDKVMISQLIAPEDRQKVADNVRRRTEGLVQEMRYTFVGMRQDGRRIDVEVHGRSMEFKGKPAVIGLVLDITERRQAEAARLTEAALRVTAAVFEAREGMVVTDAERIVLRVNRAFTESTGYTAEDVVGREMSQLLKSSRHDEAFFAAMWETIRQSGLWQGEIWNQRKDGAAYPEWVTITAVKSSADVLTHYVVTLTDITDRKRLESEMAQRIEELKALNDRLEEAQTQLLQAEKMVAVGQLAAGIAHEINNPVGFVNSNLGTLKEYVTALLQLIDAYGPLADACPPGHPALAEVNRLRQDVDFAFIRDDALSLLAESRDGLERVKRIVVDLKDFSRVGESTWQPADVHKCLDSTLNVVSSELKYKATVVKEYGVLPEIMCMPFQLNQVFMNLLVNAVHAIKEHGTIALRTGRAAETVWIEVEDSGVGIPAENLTRIFEPFFTTKPIGAGTGLGLSVSYGIVQKHRGRIEVRSELGKGTVFRVILPISPPPEADLPAQEPARAET
ncbi:MAG: PAS domain S-box protein, partial [Rhodocyclales bacterium]|nr:PAS domain S-box protein [Rhodocyclales bacterium]